MHDDDMPIFPRKWSCNDLYSIPYFELPVKLMQAAMQRIPFTDNNGSPSMPINVTKHALHTLKIPLPNLDFVCLFPKSHQK